MITHDLIAPISGPEWPLVIFLVGLGCCAIGAILDAIDEERPTRTLFGRVAIGGIVLTLCSLALWGMAVN